MKKFIITIIAIILLSATALGATVFAYTNSSGYESDVFSDNTVINGADCSGLTYAEAAQKLTDTWNSRHIIVTGSLNEELATFSDFGYTYDLEKSLKKAKQDNIIAAAANQYFKTPLSIDIPMVVAEYDESFKKTVTTAPFLDLESTTESKPAYVDTSDPAFPIVPEVYGTKPDTEKFFDDLTHQIQVGDMAIVFEEKNYYTMPEVTADSKELKTYQKYCKDYLSQKITYELGDETFTLTPDELDSLMLDDMSGKADQKAINEYVSAMADTYDNYGADRTFESYSGKTIEVKGGLYGWEIDRKAEAKQLAADINAHKDVSREPVFSKQGYGEYAKVMGDTYIDVDISTQMTKMYKNGKTIFSTPCVTGCKSTGTLTDTGTFVILNKVRNVVLRGNNVDGSEYAVPVDYWMGINYSGEGLHDSDWHTEFGGNVWIYNGSHGCINIPPAVMPTIYDLGEVGMPVVVHY